MGTMFVLAVVWVPGDGGILHTTYNKMQHAPFFQCDIGKSRRLCLRSWWVNSSPCNSSPTNLRDGELASPFKKLSPFTRSFQCIVHLALCFVRHALHACVTQFSLRPIVFVKVVRPSAGEAFLLVQMLQYGRHGN